MFQGQGTLESKLSLHSLLLKKETMNVSAFYNIVSVNCAGYMYGLVPRSHACLFACIVLKIETHEKA